MKEHFNGEMELRGPAAVVSTDKQLQHAEEYAAWRVAGNRDGAVGDPSKVHGVKRISIFYMLPY